MHSELIEWRICRTHQGRYLFHSEGAQSVFGLSRARKILKALGGDPWKIIHQSTFEEPKKDQDS